MSDRQQIQEIEARLLSMGWQERELFHDLEGQRKQGGEIVAICPFCEKPGKFSYSLSRPLWRCWSCLKQGNWQDYMKVRQRLSYGEALRKMAQAAGVELEDSPEAQEKYQRYLRKGQLLEEMDKYCQEALWKPEGAKELVYLEARGYSREEIKAMGLGAFVDRESLQELLQEEGFTYQEIFSSGAFLKFRGREKIQEGLGITHTLSLLWRDATGRPIGMVCRSILSNEELEAKSLPKYLYSKGMKRSHTLAGLDLARGFGGRVIVEGVLDALYISHLGEPTVGLGGTEIHDEQIKALKLIGVGELVLALDNDTAGRTGTDRIVRKLRQTNPEMHVFVASLPPFYKDPDEFVRAEGIDAFQEVISKAVRGSRWQLNYLASSHDLSTDRGQAKALEQALTLRPSLRDREALSFWEDLQEAMGLARDELEELKAKTDQQTSQEQAQARLNRLQRELAQESQEGNLLRAEELLQEGLQDLRQRRGVEALSPYSLKEFLEDLGTMGEGLRTQYDSLDKYLRIPEGAITLIAGRPGQGKTTLQLNLLLNMAKANPGKRFYFFSYEEAKQWLALKCQMILAGEVLDERMNQTAYLNYLKERRGSNKKVEEALATYEDLTGSERLWLIHKPMTAEELALQIRSLHNRGDTGAVFVDYIQKIKTSKPSSVRYMDIKASSEILLETAVELNIPLIMGAQFSRAGKEKKEPSLEDLRESGDLEQDAALVLGLHSANVEEEQEDGQQSKKREVDLSIRILKYRGGQAGRKVKGLRWDRPILKIKDPAGTAAEQEW